MKNKISRTVILPVLLYRCETWSLTLRTEPKLRVFESSVLSKIFGLTRGEVTGNWRRLQNEEFHDQYSSTNILWVINQEECDEWGMWHVWEKKTTLKTYT